MNNKTIAIVGGGLLGMTLALRFAERGFTSHLFEEQDEIGGLAKPQMIGKYSWDQYYHVILNSDISLLSLLEQLGLKDMVRWEKTKTGFFINDTQYSISNISEFLKFPPLKFTDKIRLGWTIFYASRIKNWKRLENITATEWLKRHSGENTYNKIWLPLMRSKLGVDAELANAVFIWSSISRLYKARKSGLKTELLGYVEGGYRNILAHFQTHLNLQGVKISIDSRITGVLSDGGRIQLEINKSKHKDFDIVILTSPCPVIAKICPQLSDSEKSRLHNVLYQNLVCVSLIIKNPLSNYYITNIADNRIPFTGIIEMTALVDKSNFGGNSLVYLPKYVNDADPLLKKDDKMIINDYISILSKINPEFAPQDCIAYNVNRIKDFPIIQTKNYSERIQPKSETTIDNLFIVNSSQIPNGTINVNEIIQLANRKADEIACLF